ncbi:MAG: DUF6686 family protein [Bacteroidota bacterium]
MSHCTQGPTVLHASRHGFLVHCSCCNHFQLGFGTFHLKQSEEEFKSFVTLIERYGLRYFRRKDRKRRDIFIDTPYPGFGLLLSAEDLDRLNNILQMGLLVKTANLATRQQ